MPDDVITALIPVRSMAMAQFPQKDSNDPEIRLVFRGHGLLDPGLVFGK